MKDLVRFEGWISVLRKRCRLILVSLPILSSLLVNSVAADRPNVIVILADDLGYGGLSCYGQTAYATPNLDRMATEGARLTHFNCPMAFCAPTRASLLTGRYPFRCGMTSNPAPDGGEVSHQMHLPESELLLPQLLKQAGYATGMIGKWHLGHAEARWLPTHRGFDSYFGIPYSNDMRPVALFEGDQQVEYPVIQANLTKRYTEQALAFIDKNSQTPFLLYLAHAMPHKPLAASEAFYKKSGAGLYADTVIELDWSIGQILSKLKETKLDENTLVIFTSDNGATFGGSTGGLRGMKGSSYEGGFRVPMIARWPGKIPAGHTSAEHAVMMDIFATVLKAANVSVPADLVIDGRDILPVLASDAKSPHDVIFGHKQSQLAVVRDARWKLHVLAAGVGLATVHKPGQKYIDPRGPDGVTILAPYEQSETSEHPGVQTGGPPKAMQLFDLQNDPSEQTDVAEKNPDVVARLKAVYDRMNRDVPTEKPKPSPNATSVFQHGSSDELFREDLSLSKAAVSLDQTALRWIQKHKCGSCHTGWPYLMGRSVLKEVPPSSAIKEVRTFFEGRIEKWDKDEAEKKHAHREIVGTATALAIHDAQTTGKLHSSTRAAFDRMWTLQRKDGAWNWPKCSWPPFEVDDYYGALLAAVGVGNAPEGYAQSEQAKVGLEKLRAYLNSTPAPNLHHRTWLLWASVKLDGLVEEEQKQATIADLVAIQSSDGGWAMEALGQEWVGRRGELANKDAPSDGYGTGLVVYVLRQAGVPAGHASIQRGKSWLTKNQRESGRWFTRSLNDVDENYISDTGTVFSVLALESCLH